MEIVSFLYMSVACEKENPAMVAMLLNYGASVNKNCIQGWTALHESVCRNNVEICEMLVKAGAKVNMPNMYGITPIFVAAQSGKVDALRMLLKNGNIFHFTVIFLSLLLCDVMHLKCNASQLNQVQTSTARPQMEPRRCMRPVRMVMRTL